MALGGIEDILMGVGVLGLLGGIRVYWEAGRECRYSGTRRRKGGIRGHWEIPRGCSRCWGHFGGIRRFRVCQGCIGGLAGTVGT